MENIWDKEMKTLYRELLNDYIEDGYSKQEAAAAAREEVLDMFGAEVRDAYSMADKVFE